MIGMKKLSNESEIKSGQQKITKTQIDTSIFC